MENQAVKYILWHAPNNVNFVCCYAWLFAAFLNNEYALTDIECYCKQQCWWLWSLLWLWSCYLMGVELSFVLEIARECHIRSHVVKRESEASVHWGTVLVYSRVLLIEVSYSSEYLWIITTHHEQNRPFRYNIFIGLPDGLCIWDCPLIQYIVLLTTESLLGSMRPVFQCPKLLLTEPTKYY
jgi:hypothetical protein